MEGGRKSEEGSVPDSQGTSPLIRKLQFSPGFPRKWVVIMGNRDRENSEWILNCSCAKLG